MKINENNILDNIYMTVDKNSAIFKLTLNTFKSLDDFKICCKVSIIECMNSGHVQKLTKCMKACLEAIEAIDLCQYFIASKSVNMKKCITFASAVVKTCVKECTSATFDKHLLKVNKSTTARAGSVFLANLQKMKAKS